MYLPIYDLFRSPAGVLGTCWGGGGVVLARVVRRAPATRGPTQRWQRLKIYSESENIFKIRIIFPVSRDDSRRAHHHLRVIAAGQRDLHQQLADLERGARTLDLQCDIYIQSYKRTFGNISKSRRRPLLGPPPGWKCFHIKDTIKKQQVLTHMVSRHEIGTPWVG